MKTMLCAIAAAACAVALAGCGTDDNEPGGSDATPSGSATSTATDSPTTPTSPGSTSSPASPTASTSSPTTAAGECTNQDVTATYRHEDDATSHSYGFIVLTNTSDHTCWVQGYGGISYAGDDGAQIGAAADRTPGATTKVTLAPGDTAESEIVETSYGPYTAKECRPTKAVALRVYLPDETDSQLIDHPVTACANDRIHLLEHKPYTAG